MARANLSRGKVAQVEGIEDLVKHIESLQSKVAGEEAQKVLMKAALKYRDKARELAPVDKGVLRDNIVAAYGKNRQKKTDEIDVIVTVRYGTGGGNHAHLLEFSTSKMPAHPFMRPALAATKKEMIETIAEGFKEIIEGKE